ncbi:S-layer homology domain-containing protein [Kyrpidia tusciae]|uniref:S-layer domain protein n=1 Tax=Kyrpidia tusciae (strain DSM 2912 / NBRC 15312 / T2) TaxID=562970 RepID=D5WWJ5_KYRT2|nr:S-layer homology domain-containing protein [Kyrpidia tusciae]ADG07760.1 S-layer domain protein [Kyrpidia tusciae DSM 2912]
MNVLVLGRRTMFSVLTMVSMLVAMLPTMAFAAVPSDISGHWAEPQIADWVNKGLIKGYPDGTFKPDNNISRAEFMALVNGAFGFSAKSDISYIDVPNDAWFYDVVAEAKAAGYINGYDDGTMRPNSPITRAEAAAIIMQVKKLTADPAAADKFTDGAAIPAWSKGAIGAVAGAQIMNGYPDGTFRPDSPITRAEAVVALDKALTATSAASTLSVTTASLAAATVGSDYSANLQASGGTAPYSWSLVGGSLPDGLTLTTDGTISGTPTTAGTSTFTVQVTDSSGTPQSATADLSITVNPSSQALSINTESLPDATVGSDYSVSLDASGGTSPYTWSVVDGSLPDGLTLSNDGTISGTPTTAGTSTFTVQVTDSSGTPQSATADLSITVNPSSQALSINTESLPDATVGSDYAASLDASGGTSPYTWSVVDGSLPDGLSLSSEGTISGTPTTADTVTFTVQVTDSSDTPQTATASFGITVHPASETAGNSGS